MTASWILSGFESGLLYTTLSVFAGASLIGLRTLRGQRRGRALRTMLLVGLALLTVLLVAMSVRERHLPVVERYEILVFSAWLLAVGVALLDRRIGQPALLAVMAPTILLLVFFGLLLVPRLDAPRPALRVGQVVHVALAILGLSALTFAAGVGLFYLRQIRTMKRQPLAALSRRLPPLELLDRLNFKAVVVGFPALALGALGGYLFASGNDPIRPQWWLDPTVLSTSLGLLVYLALILARAFLGWYGRRIAWMTLAGFVVLVVGYVVAFFCTSPNVLHTT